MCFLPPAEQSPRFKQLFSVFPVPFSAFVRPAPSAALGGNVCFLSSFFTLLTASQRESPWLFLRFGPGCVIPLPPSGLAGRPSSSSSLFSSSYFAWSTFFFFLLRFPAYRQGFTPLYRFPPFFFFSEPPIGLQPPLGLSCFFPSLGLTRWTFFFCHLSRAASLSSLPRPFSSRSTGGLISFFFYGFSFFDD